MDLSVQFNHNLGDALADSGRYCRLIGKLIYLTATRPNITFAIGVLSQYMQTPH